MSLVPSTPPRKGKKTQPFKSPLNLKTPQTSKKLNARANTPIKGYGQNLMPLTPDFTPQKSPRQRKKRTVNVLEGSTTDYLFLPTPSTVGTGRKTNNVSHKTLKAGLSMQTLLNLNDGLNFESESEENGEDAYDDDGFFMSNNNKTFISNKNLLKSPSTIIPIQPESPTKFKVPKTPGHLLIDDDKINEWYGQSKAYFSDEDLPETQIRSKTFANPFLALSPQPASPVAIKNTSGVDYSTHAEFIHNKTGERKVVKLLDRQANVKPKKLDFSSAV